jgi:hypothetical protein
VVKIVAKLQAESVNEIEKPYKARLKIKGVNRRKKRHVSKILPILL